MLLGAVDPTLLDPRQQDATLLGISAAKHFGFVGQQDLCYWVLGAAVPNTKRKTIQPNLE